MTTAQPLFKTQESAPVAGPGHNQPPEPKSQIDVFQTNIERQIKPHVDDINQIIVGLNKLPEEIDAKVAKRYQDFLKQVKEKRKRLEEFRVELKTPHDQRAQIIQDLLGPKSALREQLATYEKKAKGRYDVWKKAEDARKKAVAEEKARKAEEEKRRLEQEAAEAARKAETLAENAQSQEERKEAIQAFEQNRALSSAAEVARRALLSNQKTAKSSNITRGEYGSIGFTRPTQVLTVEDMDALPASKIWPYVDPAEKERAVKKALQAGVELPGAKLEDDKIVVVK